MYKNNKLSKSIRLAMAFGTVAAVALPSHAIANVDEEEVAAVERIQVTGSRILRQGTIAPSPVTVISGQDLVETGAMNIGEVLARLPAMANTYTLANSGRFIGTAGASLLDLRGMGVTRTLVLVDGRRHVASSAGSASVDTNTIPSSWIERVEIITGGASAVYGADAVTGVVNFILKRDIEGFDATLTKGFSEHSSYQNEKLTLSYGRSVLGGRGNIAGSVEYNAQNTLNALDHPWTRTNNVTLGYEAYRGGPRPEWAQSHPDFPDTYRIPVGGHYRISEAGTVAIGGFAPENFYTFNQNGDFRQVNVGDVFDVGRGFCQGDCDFIDLNQYTELQPKFDRVNMNLRGSYEINDNLNLTAEAKYVRTDGRSLGQPFFHFLSGAYMIQRDNPFVRPEMAQVMDDANASSAFISKMHSDSVGRRDEDNTRETTRVVIALDGEITQDWGFDAALVWGKTEIERANKNNVIVANFQNAMDAVLDSDGNIVCRSEEARAAGCTAINIMNRQSLSEQLTPEQLNYLWTTSVGKAEVEQKVATFNVNNSFLFALPAGNVGFAGGLEYRHESSQSSQDPFAQTGATFFNVLSEVDGSFNVSEVYGELSIPLLHDLPFIQDLILEPAIRHADYSTIGAATSWKVGLDWTVNSDTRLRFTVSEALRAPNISDLFGSQSQTFYSVNDPCRLQNLNNQTPDNRAIREANCRALGVPEGFDSSYDNQTLEGLTGGNPDLQPEDSTSITAGLIYQPSWLPGFSTTIDYWEIDITDTISPLSAQRILNECVDAANINNQFCARINRNQSGSQQGEITLIENFSLNIARTRNRGVDFETSYDFDAYGGKVRTSLMGTYLIEARQYPFQDEPEEFTDFSGVLGDATLQARLTVDYRRDNWSLGLRARFSDGVDLYSPTSLENNPNPSNVMQWGSYTVADITGTYFFDNGIRLTLGIDNVLDRGLPFDTLGTSAGAAYYDNIGRFGYVRFGYSF
jgi:iron complex outermembrane receptor protein